MSERKNKSGLGKGLENIFQGDGTFQQMINEMENNPAAIPAESIREIPISEIRPNPYQPRKDFDKKALEDLADSIRVHGVFTPLLVRKSIQGYDLVTGERRLRAAKMADLETVPAIEVDFSDEDMMEISILENVQREDLNPIEEASAYDSLVKKLGYTQEKLAERVGKDRVYVANSMRLLKLPENVQTMLINKKLAVGHVRPLLALKDDDQIYDAAEYVLKHKLTAREVENYVHSLMGTTAKKTPRKTSTPDPWLKDVENRMQSKLQTQVDINSKAINIRYSGTEDLNRILEILGCIEESESED